MSGKSLADLYVLLVEPSSAQSKYIVNELKQAGITHFDTADTCKMAISLMHQMHPDLVISAMHLPDMTGSDLVQQMRNDEELDSIAFMLISSETGFEYLEPVKQAGVTAILPKPFESSQLKRALFNTLDIISPDHLQFEDIHVEDLRVLIVDDSRMARHHIRRVMNGLGIEQIVEADDGASAVPLLDEQFFDFIISDYNMPEMDGKALLDYIRHQSNQRSIPVIMVTSEGNRGVLSAIEQAGVSGICDKPFETDTVRQLIMAMMTEV
ncbi:MAG: response regulator [Gammaproteobacteria bacterium]|nr:response regulator [Gammaproteobacteria bacterium]